MRIVTQSRVRCGGMRGIAYAIVMTALVSAALMALTISSDMAAQARSGSRPLPRLAASTDARAGDQISAPLQLVISLRDQKLSVYDNGRLMATSRISSGQVGHQTPTGVFSILEKSRFHRSNIYSNAPMPFMQRITYSGIALHEGILPGYPASHGCIRLPRDFAARLFSQSNVGTRVIVVGEAVMPRPIAHPRLFKYRPRTADTGPQVRLPEDVGLFLPEAMEMALSNQLVRTADASGAIVSRGDVARMQRLARQRTSPVSIFISRKEGRLFARQRMQPMLEAPVRFTTAGTSLGTHVLTALSLDDDGTTLRWNVVSMPAGKGGDTLDVAAALEAIDIPPYAVERLGELMVPGSSIIISDAGLGYETVKQGGSDFIVLTK